MNNGNLFQQVNISFLKLLFDMSKFCIFCPYLSQVCAGSKDIQWYLGHVLGLECIWMSTYDR